MKKVTILVLGTIISLAVTGIPKKVDSAPEKSIDWSKIKPDWNTLLTKVPTPRSVGNILIDGGKNKNDCHMMGFWSNNQGRKLTSWTCWAENSNIFTQLSAKWSNINPNLGLDTPRSVGNT